MEGPGGQRVEETLSYAQLLFRVEAMSAEVLRVDALRCDAEQRGQEEALRASTAEAEVQRLVSALAAANLEQARATARADEQHARAVDLEASIAKLEGAASAEAGARERKLRDMLAVALVRAGEAEAAPAPPARLSGIVGPRRQRLFKELEAERASAAIYRDALRDQAQAAMTAKCERDGLAEALRLMQERCADLQRQLTSAIGQDGGSAGGAVRLEQAITDNKPRVLTERRLKKWKMMGRQVEAPDLRTFLLGQSSRRRVIRARFAPARPVESEGDSTSADEDQGADIDFHPVDLHTTPSPCAPRPTPASVAGEETPPHHTGEPGGEHAPTGGASVPEAASGVRRALQLERREEKSTTVTAVPPNPLAAPPSSPAREQITARPAPRARPVPAWKAAVADEQRARKSQMRKSRREFAARRQRLAGDGVEVVVQPAQNLLRVDYASASLRDTVSLPDWSK